jgi:hypothetical protein
MNQVPDAIGSRFMKMKLPVQKHIHVIILYRKCVFLFYALIEKLARHSKTWQSCLYRRANKTCHMKTCHTKRARP